MTREEALSKFNYLYEDGFTKEDILILINKIYDDFENNKYIVDNTIKIYKGIK